MPRRRLYTEHKYVSFRLSEFSRLVGQTNFIDDKAVFDVMEKFNDIKDLMNHHAQHENDHIHELLRKKGSTLQGKIEADHAKHATEFATMDQLLKDAYLNTDSDAKITLGNRFLVEFQLFEAGNLRHQIFEETVILPELQRLYTDAEILNAVDGPVYAQMSPQDMIGMCTELFPHFNRDDREGMLRDIQLSQPQKFQEVWNGVKPIIAPDEQVYLIDKLHINPPAVAPAKVALSAAPNLWSSSNSQTPGQGVSSASQVGVPGKSSL